MLQKTKGPSAKKGRMSRLMDVGTRFRRSLIAKQALPTTPFRFRDSIKSRAAAYCDAAVAIAAPSKPCRGTSKKSPHKFNTAAMATDSRGVVASLKPKQAACATEAMSVAGSASARTATYGAAARARSALFE